MRLVVKMKYAEVKWQDYIKQTFGEEWAKQCTIESVASAKEHQASIQFADFKKDNELINQIKNNENVISAFIINDKKIVETIVG